MDAETEHRVTRWALQAAARELLPESRVRWCMRRVAFNPDTRQAYDTVDVMYSERVKRAHYRHLMTCALVWHCPICAAKITERRRVELSEAIANNGELVPVLVTFTLSHHKRDKLSVVLDALLAAYRQLKSGRAWLEFEHKYNVVGSVRGLEVTYGDNAWHPHIHTLFFFRRGVSLEIEPVLKTRWNEALKKQKRGASWARGVTVQFANADIAAYVSKLGADDGRAWNVEHEITKSGAKRGKTKSGKTPTQLLAEYAVTNSKSAGARWKEYAETFKGKRQLVWSRGLRNALGVGSEMTDEEIAGRVDESAVLLASLSLAQWRVVLANDARGEVLEVASSGDARAVWAYLRRLGADDAGVIAEHTRRMQRQTVSGRVVE